MEFDHVQDEFDITWNRHAIFKIAAIFQHLICPVCPVCVYVYVYVHVYV